MACFKIVQKAAREHKSDSLVKKGGWPRMEQNQQIILFLHMKKRMTIINQDMIIKKHEEITQTTKRIMYITDTMAYTYITARSLV
jgi:hypothetical protein